MACQPGYIEVNGNCVYSFGNDSGVGPDGTPIPQNSGGGFWDWVNKNLPDILISAGSILQSNRNNQNQSPTPSGGQTPTPPEKQNAIPVWVWILLAVALIIIVILLLRRNTPAPVI